MSDSTADSEHAVALTILKIDECFVYRIPPLQTSDGHRAELWGLDKPIATCSLTTARRGNELFVDFFAERPKKNAPEGALEKYRFAQAQVAVDLENPSHSIEHWVIPVVDSSRYFAVRIKDAKSGREAFIGCGFRERNDAINFRFSIEDYINSLKREMKAKELQQRFEESLEVSGEEEKLPMPKSSLSLKEGEKIHINIKGKKVSRSPRPKKAPNQLGLGLKKPPPPPPMNSVAVCDDDNDEWGDFVG